MFEFNLHYTVEKFVFSYKNIGNITFTIVQWK